MSELVRTDVPEQQVIRLMNLVHRLFGPAGDLQFAIPLFDLDLPPDPKKVYYDERVKFTYYGATDMSKNHEGVIVLATFVDENEGVIYYGTAFCSPKDEYQKHIGKRIAFDDLAENMTVTALGKKKHHDINSRVLADIWASKTYPSWAEEGIAAVLCDHFEEMFG